jgi:aspartyl-tRNA(Asn)/glutamyl-tRNA(Gln) amidotransferase subunit A
MTIVEAARLQDAGRISSVELTAQCLSAVAKRNGRLNALITVLETEARSQASRLDSERAAGHLRGPLHGIPIALKDVFCTRRIRTTVGSKIWADHVPNYNSAVAEKLEAAGAVLLGKAHMHELAYGVTSNNPHFGPVRNPWNEECIPGGSSGGSGSAVASGMCLMAMGSDTGGSIRIPAAYCGTVGIKPTTGRVSRFGVMPLDFTLDHMGPLTATVADAALCLQAIAGYDPRDDSSSPVAVGDYFPQHPSVRGLRIGLPVNFYFDRVQADIAQAIHRLARNAEAAGAIVKPVHVPDMASVNTIGRVILLTEASSTMMPYLKDRSLFGADVLALLDQGRLLSGTGYVQAQRLRRVFQREFAQLWKQVDVILTPTAPNSAPRIGASEVQIGGAPEDVRLAATRLVRGINVLGLPALAIPAGRDAANMPVSAQLIGKPFSEAALFRAGAVFETLV